MKEHKISDKHLRQLAAWDLFLDKELGCLPSTLAALTLRMTTSGVYNAAQRGYIVFFQVGRDRWYGKKSVLQYKYAVSRKFSAYRLQPEIKPQNFFTDSEAS